MDCFTSYCLAVSYLVLQFDVCTSWAFPSPRWWWLNDTENLTALRLVVRYDRNCDGTFVRNSLHHPADLVGKHPIRFWKYLFIDKVSRSWYIAVPTEVMINRPCARHVTDCYNIHALFHGLLHNFPSSTALTSQRARPVTRHKNDFHNIQALLHNVFYRSHLHSRANQALLSNVRMLISCYAMLHYVRSCFLCFGVYLMKNVPSSHGNHARYATLSSASSRSS